MPIMREKAGMSTAMSAPLPPRCMALKPRPEYRPRIPDEAMISRATVMCSATPIGEIEYAGRVGSRKSFFCTTERTTSPGAFGKVAKKPARKPATRVATGLGMPLSIMGGSTVVFHHCRVAKKVPVQNDWRHCMPAQPHQRPETPRVLYRSLRKARELLLYLLSTSSWMPILATSSGEIMRISGTVASAPAMAFSPTEQSAADLPCRLVQISGKKKNLLTRITVDLAISGTTPLLTKPLRPNFW
mmetsp:Transcript_2289/g.7019  ORF Transcript_2289/g.7019 Transcript_2289/m.7019 type:complete len:244 (+) Transcript_2289:266-997(+)